MSNQSANLNINIVKHKHKWILEYSGTKLMISHCIVTYKQRTMTAKTKLRLDYTIDFKRFRRTMQSN